MNKKLCCFYLNDIHLITMLLPYINERINQSTKIITIFEKDISKSAKKVISGIQGKKSNKLLKINWNSKKYEEVKNCNMKNSLILICGSDEYIKDINDIIASKNEECDILDCYEMIQGSANLYKILEEHDRVVNTSGERLPEEVFTGFTQKNYI